MGEEAPPVFLRNAFIVTAALLGLAGCADPANDAAMAAQNALGGMPKGTPLSCAGVPERQAFSGRLGYFTFQARSINYYAPPPPIR